MSLQELLEKTIASNASDLHLCTGYPPTLRVDGKLRPIDGPPLTEEETLAFIAELLPEAEAETWANDPMSPPYFNYGGPGGSRFRTVIHRHFGGSAITMRLWPSGVPAPDRLGIPTAAVERVCSATRGLVLISGPTGSGKSTTLYSLVDHINANRSEHIIWMSDPAEFVLEPKRSMIRTIEVGPHFARFARYALRLDPDVVVIGEMRDLETVSLSMTMAETGHLVFTTIHCRTAPEAVSRIVDVFPAEQQGFVARQLATVLDCVIAQQLIPRADGKGRVAAFEVMFATPEIRELIAGRRFEELPARLTGSAGEGMQSLRQELDRLVREGAITEAEARIRP
jgi:twitching motility protein PilT